MEMSGYGGNEGKDFLALIGQWGMYRPPPCEVAFSSPSNQDSPAPKGTRLVGLIGLIKQRRGSGSVSHRSMVQFMA